MRRLRAARQINGRVALLLGLWGAVGCRSAATQRQQLDSIYPLDQVTAAVWLADAGDPEAVPRLVRLLEDRDRTVRMYAILALEHLSGETYGYEYYAPEPQRQAAIRRWQQALRRGEVRAGQARPENQVEEVPTTREQPIASPPDRAAQRAAEQSAHHE